MKLWKQHSSDIQYFNPNKNTSHQASLFFRRLLTKQMPADATAIFLCIGTDRITGDCLGPMTGTRLSRAHCSCPVVGTLQNPVHAKNLPMVLQSLRQSYQHPFFIVIDAAVGSEDLVGNITISSESILPGAGISRPIVPIGDISITGIIGTTGTTDLSCTRLFLVDQLSRYIKDLIIL